MNLSFKTPIYLKTSDLASSSKTYILNRQVQPNPAAFSKTNNTKNASPQPINGSNVSVSGSRVNKQNVLVISSKDSSLKKRINLAAQPCITSNVEHEYPEEPTVAKKQQTLNSETLRPSLDQSGIPRINQITQILQANGRRRADISIQEQTLQNVLESEKHLKEVEQKKRIEEEKETRQYIEKKYSSIEALQRENKTVKQSQLEAKQLQKKATAVESVSRGQVIESSLGKLQPQHVDKPYFSAPSALEMLLRKEVNLFLTEDVPKKCVIKARDEDNHEGQRKLLICEIWFLTQFGHLSSNVIYAGSGRGHHIGYLSKLFKGHHFYVHGQNDFKLESNDHIHLQNGSFLDVNASNYFQKMKGDYLLICDIGASKGMTRIENEELILENNKLQMKWVEIMRPRKKAILKFKCVHPSEIMSPTIFLKGDILIPPWAGEKSRETWLVPYSSIERVHYDNWVYEQQMCYHNEERRKKMHIVSEIEMFDGSWDCCAEWLVLCQFIQKFKLLEKKPINEAVSYISSRITLYFANIEVSDK